MTQELLTALYIAASVLFILSLGGLSDQEKAKKAVWYGIIGTVSYTHLTLPTKPSV